MIDLLLHPIALSMVATLAVILAALAVDQFRMRKQK